jgi:hypothetical protein
LDGTRAISQVIKNNPLVRQLKKKKKKKTDAGTAYRQTLINAKFKKWKER